MLDIHEDTNSVGDELGLFTPTESTVPNPSPIFNARSDVKLFDMDAYTGFMPSSAPLPRLPLKWEAWEVLLDDAVAAKLHVGDNIGSLCTYGALISWRRIGISNLDSHTFHRRLDKLRST